jgi:hypothetical protein
LHFNRIMRCLLWRKPENCSPRAIRFPKMNLNAENHNLSMLNRCHEEDDETILFFFNPNDSIYRFGNVAKRKNLRYMKPVTRWFNSLSNLIDRAYRSNNSKMPKSLMSSDSRRRIRVPSKPRQEPDIAAYTLLWLMKSMSQEIGWT